MKNITLLLIGLFISSITNAQYPAKVGDSESGGVMLPYDNQFDYNWCTTIYPQNKINAWGNISKIFLDVSSITPGLDIARDQKIFMALTSDVEFTDAGYPDTNSMTKVFDGDIIYFTPGGPEDPDEIILSTPFFYNNSDNLIVHYENYDGTKVSTISEGQINLTDNSSSLNICKYNSQDGTFPNTSGTLSNKMPIIYLGFDSGLDVGISKINSNKDFLLPGIHDLTLNFRNYSGDTITSGDINWELNGITQSIINWTGTVYTGQESSDIPLLNSYDFSPGDYNIKAWMDNPNSGTDLDNNNDTLNLTIHVANYIEIGNNSYNNTILPYPTYNFFGWSSSIYNSDSIQYGRIDGIAYNNQSQGYFRNNQKIYLSQTSGTSFSSADLPAEASMSLVYNGNIDYSGTIGWKKIIFDSSFVYNNNNLVVHYQNHSDQYNAPNTSFRGSNYGYSLTIYNGDNASFPLTTGSTFSRAADIRLYFALPNDAGITTINEPYISFNTGTNEIKASIKNFGTDTLKNVEIKYQINNGTIETYNWSGDLPSYETINNVTIGSSDFSFGNHIIKVWTENPNNFNDYNNENDTTLINVFACSPLNGTYVIGSAPSDFLTLKEAIDSLNSPCGISGSVIFEIKPGIYYSQNSLYEIYGANESFNITFQSQTGDSTDVIITSDSTDYTFSIFGADNIAFKNLTFTTDTNPTTIIEIGNRSDDILIEGCIFIGNEGSGSLIYSADNDSSIDKNLVIKNNLFQKGSISVNLYPGNKNGEYETGLEISNNYFQGQSSQGIYYNYFDSIVINNNTFTSGQWAIYGWGTNVLISGNLMKNDLQGTFRIYGANYLIKNNMANVKGYSGYLTSTYLSCDNSKFYNNTIIVKDGGNNCNNIWILRNNNDFKNNLLINNDYGKIFYINGTATGNTFDYNVYYNTNNKFEDSYNSFSDWQSGTSQDANSYFEVVNFINDTNLHTNSLFIDGAGTPLPEVSVDFDNETRDAANPDIGADEFSSSCSTPLSGTYSLGSTGTFSSFSEAVNALYYCGLSGDVTFNIEDGTYNTQLLLDKMIPGQNLFNITFTSVSSNNSNVIIEYNADSANNYVIKLYGADNITFDKLTLRSINSEYGRVLEIGNGACNNLIQNCIITGVVSTDDNNNQALIYFPEDNVTLDTSNTFKGNTFNNGSYGINLQGNDNNRESFNSILGNDFIDQSAFSIYADYQMNLLIENNQFENNYQVDFDLYGIKNIDSDSTLIIKNIFNLQRDCNIYALSVDNYPNYNLIANNFISLNSNTLTAKGINNAGYNTRIYNNSINIYGGLTNSVAIDITYNTNSADIKNNIFANNTGGYALKCSFSGTQILSADNNNFYSNGDNIVNWLGSDMSDLSEWKTTTSFGTNSVSSYPNFVSNTDLHISNVLLNNAGTPLPEITVDIDNEARDISNPDIGADEFSDLTFSLGKDRTTCIENEIKIDAGSGFDSYLWSTGSDSSITIIDSAGIGYGSKEISVIVDLGGTFYYDTINATFSSPIANPITDYCFNEDVDSILISAGEGVSYHWYYGQTTQSIWVSSGSWYQVTVTDSNGCTDQGDITVNYNYCQANLNMPVDTTIYFTNAITLDANTDNCWEDYSNFSYIWNTGDTTETIIIDSLNYDLGNYVFSVRIINKLRNNCESYDSVNITLAKPLGLSDVNNNKNIVIFPNPTNGMVYIRGEKIERLEVYNLQGQIIKSITGSRINLIDLAQQPKGIYLVKIIQKDKYQVKKIVLE